VVQARVFDKPTDIVQLAALGAYLHRTVTMCAIHNPYLRDICLSYHAYTKGRTQLPIHNAIVVAAADWAPPTSAKMWVLLWHLLPPRLQAGIEGGAHLAGGDDGPAAVFHARNAPQADT
jgi:hypothetical protein